MKSKQGITLIELLKYLVVVFILTTLGSFIVGCSEMATSGRYIVKTPYFECTGILYYNPVRFKCDDGTMYYYITNYTLKEITNEK